MTERRNPSASRGILLQAAFLLALLLSYYGIRNAVAVHFAARETPQGFQRAIRMEPDDEGVQEAQVCLARLESEQAENKIQRTAWVDDVRLVPASLEHAEP